MNGPRLGDDAYVYLWYSLSSIFNDLGSSPALTSLEQFAASVPQQDIPAEARDNFYRILLRTGNIAQNYIHMFLGLIMPASWSFYALFWFQEFFIVIVMSAGLYTLFRTQTELRGTGFLLVLLALAILPGQGIHFFIPSTLALSFGMIVWGLVLSRNAHPILLFLIGFAALLSHPVGIVHAGLGGLLVIVRFLQAKIEIKRAMLEASALLIALAALVIFRVLYSQDNSGSTALVTYGFHNIGFNFSGWLNNLYVFFKRDTPGLIIVLIGLIGFLKIFRLKSALSVIATILAACIFVTSLHGIDGYPSEAMIRITVPLIFILFMHVYMNEKIDVAPEALSKLQTRTGVFYAIFLIAMAANTYSHALSNRETRWPQIDRAILSEQIASLPSDAHLLFLEEDIALQSSLLAGSYAYKTSTISLLNGNTELGFKWLNDNPPSHAVALVPGDLTPRRKLEKPIFSYTAPGFDLRHGGNVELQGFTVSNALLRFSVDASEFKVVQDGVVCNLESVTDTEWYQVSGDCTGRPVNPDTVLEITGEGIVTGIQEELPSSDIHWPWGSSIKYSLNSGSRLGQEYETIESGFSFDYLIEDYMKSPYSETYVWKVLSDHSGVVFLTRR